AGIVAWLGKNRSYESKPISGQRSIVAVTRSVPRRLASAAGTGSAKKIQACAPLPERDRSMATGTPFVRVASRNAETSFIQDFLSKSAARNQQVSSGSIGYTPTVKSAALPDAFPARCERRISSPRGMIAWFGHSLHLTCGFAQTPRTHSFRHMGA